MVGQVESAAQHPDPSLRIVLVGRTGLDGALRLDPALELVRVRTPLEAVGELANPVDPGAPPAAAVILSGDAYDSLSNLGPHRFTDFLNAAKGAQPGVRVMTMTEACGDKRNGLPNGRADSVVDGSIDAAWPPEQIRQSVRAACAAPCAKSKPAAPPVVDDAVQLPVVRESTQVPNTAPAATASVGAGTSVGDAALVVMMLKGQDVLPAAIASVRARTGDSTIEFVPEDEPRAGATVASEGVNYGKLISANATTSQLDPHARWLAGWLRLRDQQGQLRHAAFTDPLTGAWNRRYFDRFLATAIDQAKGARRPVTVLLFDIDNFKSYNDRYGHDAGDEILKEAVRLIRSVIRPTDRVCRVGGDEFAVIFNEPEGPRQEGSRHPATVFQLAQRFQQQILQHRFPKLGDCAPGTLTISGGLATFPWDGATPEELLIRADQLSLESKRQGKNAITLGPGAMRSANE